MIDAIFFAIEWWDYYGRQKDLAQLVTKWETQWSIAVTLKSTGKQYIVTRTFDVSWKTTITIAASDWTKISANEAKSWLSDFTIDPLLFMNKTKKEMFDIIKSVAWIDTKEIDEKIDVAFETRKVAWYNSDSKKKTVEQLWDVEYAMPVDVTELWNELLAATKHNEIITQKESQLQNCRSKHQRAIAEIEELKIKIQQLEKVAEESKSEWIKLKSDLEWLVRIDIDPIQEKIANAKSCNEKATLFARYQLAKKEYDEAVLIREEADDYLAKARQEKTDLIIGWKYPIDWMVLDEENWVLIDWIPFDQYSSGQQLVHAIKLAQFWLDKPIKMVWIKNWALLDEDALNYVTNYADFADYQMFIELVWETHADSIVLREWSII